MNRLVSFPLARRLSSTPLVNLPKLNNKGGVQTHIPEWAEENVDVGFMTGRVDTRVQLFKRQTQKMGARRRTRVQIVDNSKWATTQTYQEPEFVISYRKQRRFHNGTTGDMCLITVDGQFKRAIYVGMSKQHQTFRPWYDTNMVVILNEEGGPEGTRILAPLPAWLRDKEKHVMYKAYKFQDVQINKLLAICPRFV